MCLDATLVSRVHILSVRSIPSRPAITSPAVSPYRIEPNAPIATTTQPTFQPSFRSPHAATSHTLLPNLEAANSFETRTGNTYQRTNEHHRLWFWSTQGGNASTTMYEGWRSSYRLRVYASVARSRNPILMPISRQLSISISGQLCGKAGSRGPARLILHPACPAELVKTVVEA